MVGHSRLDLPDAMPLVPHSSQCEVVAQHGLSRYATQQNDDLWLDQIDLLLDDGVTAGGVPSTVVNVVKGRVSILRTGAIDRAALADVLGYSP